MREGHRSNPPPRQTQEHVDVKPYETAAELRRPKNLKELREATEDVFLDVEVGLSFHAMGEQFETVAWEEWVQVADVLESLFLEEKDGVLGKRLLELHAMDDAQFQSHHGSAQDLIAFTQPYASELAPLVERLVLFGYADSMDAAVARLSHGTLVADEKLFGTPVKQTRVSLIGLLRDVEARLGGQVWSLEHAPEMPNQVVLRDPFDASDPEVAALWRDRILARRTLDRSAQPTVFSESAEVTQKLVYEFGVLSEREGEEGVQQAGQVLADWLTKKGVYYDRPQAKLFESYHLGLESPETVMMLLKALDTIKHAAPAFFVELTGTRAEGEGPSRYFGSFLHKALVNTTRVVESRRGEVGDLALVTMVDDLLTMDGRVQTYAGVMTQQGLKHMASHMAERIGQASTAQDKAGELISVIAPYVPLAVDAGVRMQLEAFREHNVETVREDMRRFVDDPTQTLTALEYIAQMSPDLVQDAQVHKMLGELFAHCRLSEGTIAKWSADGTLVKEAGRNNFDLLQGLYRRIPLNDPSKSDFGEGERMRVMVRDFEARLSLRSKVGLATVGHVAFSNGSVRALLREYQHEWSGRYPASAFETQGSDPLMRRYFSQLEVENSVQFVPADHEYYGASRVLKGLEFVPGADHAWFVALSDNGFRELYAYDAVEAFDEQEYEHLSAEVDEVNARLEDAFSEDARLARIIRSGDTISAYFHDLDADPVGERRRIESQINELSKELDPINARYRSLELARRLHKRELPPVKDVLYCMLGQKDGMARVWKHLDVFAEHLDPVELMAVLDGWYEGEQVRPYAMRSLLQTCIEGSSAPDYVKEYMRVLSTRLIYQAGGRKVWNPDSDQSASAHEERCVRSVEELRSLRFLAESEQTPLARTITIESEDGDRQKVIVDPVYYWHQLKRRHVPVLPLSEVLLNGLPDRWWNVFEVNMRQGIVDINARKGQRTKDDFALSATLLSDLLLPIDPSEVSLTRSDQDAYWESRRTVVTSTPAVEKIQALLSSQFERIR